MSREHVVLPTIQLLGIALKTRLIAMLMISLLLISLPRMLIASVVARALVARS
jgi:hypothetical protein